jgi:hypothetical protein
MRLFDHADGVAGHYCIGRRIGRTNFMEFYNHGTWQSAGQVFITKGSAEFMLLTLRREAAGWYKKQKEQPHA